MRHSIQWAKCLKVAALAGMSTAIFSADVHADEGTPLTLGAFMGVDFLSKQNELGNSLFDDQVPGNGFVLGVRAGYPFLRQDAISLSGEVEIKFAFTSTEGVGSRPSTSTPIFGWRTHVLLDYIPTQRFTPFILAGVGGETLLSGSSNMETPDTDALLYAGIGGRLDVQDNLALRIDGRGGLMAARDNPSVENDGGVTGLFELLVGVEYHFGAKAEPARDDAKDNLMAPDEIEPQAAAANLNPPSVTDNATPIPVAAPDPSQSDIDNDSIPAGVDSCPNDAEDVDGFEDKDGCPDLDNDGDGIIDVADKCPLEPETINQYEDDDGCKDELPAQVASQLGPMKGVTFQRGKSRLTKRTKKALDAAYETLKDFPMTRYEISGHTAKRGNAAKNKQLSLKRADYIKWYFVDKGIAASRLDSKGYGSEAPIDGKAKERIELKLLPSLKKVASPTSQKKTETPAKTEQPKVPESAQ